MNELKVFENQEFGKVRVKEVKGEAWFCLRDLCEILEIKNISDCKNRLKIDGVVTNEVIDNLGRTQEATFINESNLYKTIFQSRKKEAEKFTDWVTNEVLPSIRKHGMYATDELLANPDFAIKVFEELKQEREQKKQLQQTIEEQKPKVLFAESVETSKTSILIGDLAKLIKQNGYDIGQNRLFDWLRDNGYLIKSGQSKNMPTQMAMDLGLFEVKERTIDNPDGSVRITRTTKVNGKGQIYFINKFIRKTA